MQGLGGEVICEFLILSLAQCRISSERYTDCVFQHQVPTSIHHWTTLGQIHAAGKFPDVQVFSREVSRHSIVKMKTMMGRSEVISPSHFFQPIGGQVLCLLL